jgi:hypothetical protein
MKERTGEAALTVLEDKLEAEVDANREINGWYAPEKPEPPRQLPAPQLRNEPIAPPPNSPEALRAELEALAAAAREKFNKPENECDRPDSDRTMSNTADTRYQLYQERGEEILGSLAALRMSILSAAPTGGGKTHTMDRYIRDIRRDFPKAELYVISEKLDSFVGLLEAGRVKKFNMNSPELSMAYLDLVHKEMHKRLDEPKADRVKYDDQPIRLILDDWHATQGILKFDANYWRIVATKINQIVTLGREANVCLYIATQTFNLAALGMDDSNIRGNLAITCQGLVTIKIDKNGKVKKQGNYDILQLLLKNAYIVPNADDREELAREVKEVIQLSKTHQVPAIFCAIDEAMLALVPYIEIAEMTIASSNSESTDVAIGESNDDNELPTFTQEDVQNFRSALQKSITSDSPQTPASDASNDVNSCNSGNVISNQGESNSTSNVEKWEDKNWYRWLPSKAEVLQMMEELGEYYNFAYLIRNKLKKTEAAYNRKARGAIVQMLLDLERTDLIEKFEIDPKQYPFLG